MSEKMKAAIWTAYGPPEVLQLGEITKPIPEENQVLVRIHAATVTAGDCEMRRLQLPLGLSFPIRLYAGLLKPRRIPILGQEFSGVVEKAGKNVTCFQPGDQVFGTTGFGFGAYAEYICLPEKPEETQGVMAARPQILSYEESAALPTAGMEATHYIKKSDLRPGGKVLIIGAGGSIGSFAVQLAKSAGAEVTGVDRTEKGELFLSLGGDHFLDYTREDIRGVDGSFDLIIDVVGGPGVSRRLKLLKPGGTYFLAYARIYHILLAIWVSLTGDKTLSIESASQSQADLIELKELVEAGKLKSVIDRTYSLDQLAEAHRYCESGLKRGNVAITIA